MLRDPPVWGLPQEHVSVLGRGTTQERIPTAVRDAALAAEDTLVVYFAGHGLRDLGERLHLALADADPPVDTEAAERIVQDIPTADFRASALAEIAKGWL
ncbi:caspase family protein [Streptomyces sp. NBC_01808]|uniref:hypothetical protein n=1 Tax=Streptomyces sp. NBC_01808 TaxID=2975947 RepID=UPI002DD7E017|nr:hypothetical protein [Streptomyces sp. NBC_01808]WSA39557.1 caspase family protein [Streptomyces sp. NBC_01808]